MTEHVVAAGKVVGIYYTLKDSSGNVLDSNRRGGKPLAFLHGSGGILPGLERALEGKRKNDFIDVTLAPEDGYGVSDPARVRSVPRSMFPAGRELEPGMQFQGKGEDGHARVVRIVEVGDDEVRVDENHPLAGQTLHFEVTVTGVREATDDERTHGHVHGPGGHHGH
jgi:FKBP-type peptidyl-prolyl cis-trans isomerase SlyD